MVLVESRALGGGVWGGVEWGSSLGIRRWVCVRIRHSIIVVRLGRYSAEYIFMPTNLFLQSVCMELCGRLLQCLSVVAQLLQCSTGGGSAGNTNVTSPPGNITTPPSLIYNRPPATSSNTSPPATSPAPPQSLLSPQRNTTRDTLQTLYSLAFEVRVVLGVVLYAISLLLGNQFSLAWYKDFFCVIFQATKVYRWKNMTPGYLILIILKACCVNVKPTAKKYKNTIS